MKTKPEELAELGEQLQLLTKKYEKLSNSMKLKSGEVTERIKTFADALEEVPASDDIDQLLKYSGTDPEMIAVQSFAKLTIIAKALNEGWTPDWTDSNQAKYYPWFDSYKSGFGFSYSFYDCWDANSDCGSRLCFKS